MLTPCCNAPVEMSNEIKFTGFLNNIKIDEVLSKKISLDGIEANIKCHCEKCFKEYKIHVSQGWIISRFRAYLNNDTFDYIPENNTVLSSQPQKGLFLRKD